MTQPLKAQRRFNIVLLIRHPDIDPEKITQKLGLEPYNAFKNGATKTLPNGNVLPGVAKGSSWNHIYRHSGEHRIADEVELVIEVLEAHKAFVHQLCVQGGSVQIYLQLPGDVNIGGVLPWELMTRAASLRVELGLEVFPNFKQ